MQKYINFIDQKLSEINVKKLKIMFINKNSIYLEKKLQEIIFEELFDLEQAVNYYNQNYDFDFTGNYFLLEENKIYIDQEKQFYGKIKMIEEKKEEIKVIEIFLIPLFKFFH
jgi:hypothetical protein